MRVYLDHNATSPPHPAAREAMLAAMEQGGNPSSVHDEGRRARRTVEMARGQVAALVGAKPAEIVFTSGGSEANALALRGMVRAHGIKRLLVGATEHDSILATADDLAAEGIAVTRLPVDANGVLDLIQFRSILAHPPESTLVSVMLANNETGVIAPVAEIARIAKAHGVFVHTDAAQGVGRIAVSFAELGVDLLTVSAHKFGGPLGSGALVIRDGLTLGRQIAGGGQELGRRAGTENVPAIAGFGAASAAAAAWSCLAPLRDRLEQAILPAVPEAVVHGVGAPRLPNTSMIGLAGVPGETQVMAMDLAGFAISSGSACSSGKVKASHVLAAMSVKDSGNAIRVSLGPSTTEAEIDAFAAAWIAFAKTALARRRVAVAA